MEDSFKFQGLRKRLVQELKDKGINAPAVLQALLDVPRHLFFPSDFISKAYEDSAFPIEEGQTISQPFTVAYQTQLLDVKPGMKVLEIGTGSGYQAAVLCAMGANVVTIERHEHLYRTASKRLADLGYHARVIWGDGSAGAPKYAPYDRIIITAGVPNKGTILGEQLKEGGKLVAPIGDREFQRMMLMERLVENKFSTSYHGDFKFVPLVGKYGWKSGE